MRSRLIAAVAAWLLGVVVATAGSFLAVNGIAHGLLATTSQPLAGLPAHGVRAVHHGSISPPARDDRTSVSPQSKPSVIATPRATSQPTPQPAPSPSPASSGTLFTSPGGSVMASCQSGLAYLQFWTPGQGYQADDVIRGPAALARVGFEHLQSDFVIAVTCNGSRPVASVTAG